MMNYGLEVAKQLIKNRFLAMAHLLLPRVNNHNRAAQMKFSLSQALAYSLLALIGTMHQGNACASVIGFEEILTNAIPVGYKGFTWSGGWGDISWRIGNRVNFDPYPDFPVTAHTGASFAWSDNATSLSMASPTPFNLNSVWVGGWQNGGSDTVEGFLAGNLVYSYTFDVGTVYELLSLNFFGVDEVKFAATTFNLVVDDITVNEQTVPEPGTAVLTMLGVFGIVATRKRFRPANWLKSSIRHTGSTSDCRNGLPLLWTWNQLLTVPTTFTLNVAHDDFRFN